MALDSDVNNADAHLTVMFYEHDRAPYQGVPFVRIMTPGDQLNVIDQPAREDHKRRFPHQWLSFQMNQGGMVVGTSLADWNRDAPDDLNRNQLAELQILKFSTVEQVANATDGQLQRVGMGGVGLREKARRFLTRQNADVQSGEIDDLKAQIAELKAMMGDKRGPGRPPKVNADDDHASIGAAGNQ